MEGAHHLHDVHEQLALCGMLNAVSNAQVEACTRGIKVTASVVFLPDNPMSRSVSVHEYAYSINFTLLPGGSLLKQLPHLGF